ncbi:PaaI family thioesterase [Bradyrhizobium sp. USDA 4469]
MNDTTIPPGFHAVEEADSFIGHVGGLHWQIAESRADTALVAERRHGNPNGTVHGGVLMTMLDITLGGTAKSALGLSGHVHPTTVQLSTSFTGAARIGELILGEARIDTQTRGFSFVSGRLHVNGRTIATATAVFRNPPQDTRS